MDRQPGQGGKIPEARLKEVGVDQLGIRTFVGPQQQRLSVADLLDSLEADYELRSTHRKCSRT